MNRNFKDKVSLVFVLILAILGTICTCLATGEVLTELRRGEVIIDSQHIHTFPDGSYIDANQLWEYYDLYCCQKGTALTGYGSTSLVGSNGDELGVSYPYLTRNNIGMTILSRREAFPSSTYKNKTIGHYRIAGTYIATPKEAYVLSEMILAEGLGQADYTQLAWWTTEAGSTGNTVEATDFSKEADAFEAYILQAAGVLSTDELKYKTAQFVTAEGETKTYENAFDFEYEPEWVTEDEYIDLDVVWDSDAKQFTIGPFAIDYVGSTEQFGERPEVQFAGISGMNIYTDASSEPLEFEKDWNFVWIDGERTEETNSKFPLANEKFYIRVNYIENATMITNIKTEFKYMNACGVYQKLDGKYFEATWRQDYKIHTKTEYDDEGDPYEVYDYTEYWLELMSLTEHDSQLLALGLNGARWYEFVEIDRNLGINFGKVRIEKKIVDEEGVEVDGEDDFFTFNLTVNGAQNSGTEKIKVKAGSAATSKVYWWFEGESVPTFQVSEDEKEDYKLVSIEPSSASLVPYQTVNVVAKNTRVHEGSLELVKLVEEKELNGRYANLDGKQFSFDVALSGTFKYNGEKVEEGTKIIPVNLTISNGEARWNSGTVTWYGDKAPTYVVTELPNPYAETLSITPSSGSLADNETVVVTAINDQIIERAQIEIIKTLENADQYSEEEIMKLQFKFLIEVEGYAKNYVTLSPVRENNTYVWRYISGYYRWFSGTKNPEYSITEYDNPEGTEFVGASANVDYTVDVSKSRIKGTLVGNGKQSHTVTNNIINKIERKNEGVIQLTKIIDEDTLIDKDYSFAVTVEGTFNYDGVEYKDAKIKLTSNPDEPVADASEDGKFVTIHVGPDKVATWTSKTFTWVGENAPKYKVEEHLVGLDVASSIEPSEGTLADGIAAEGSILKTVKVSAWNRDLAKAGYLRIIKTLENADKVSADYVNSLVFKFKIEVAGYDPYIVSLNAKLVDNKYVWEYVSDKFSWKSTEAAPTYTITEIDVPKGTEFVSANGGTSETVTGQLQESTVADHIITTDNEYINKVVEHTGSLKIDKKVTKESLKGVNFNFKVTLTGSFEYNGVTYSNESVTFDASVAGGSEWNSGTITWYGESAPTYAVEEVTSDVAKNISVINGSGTIQEGTEATIATFINEPETTGGYLQITKHIDGSIQTDDEFTFRVTVEGYDPFIIKIKANQVYKSDYYVWDKVEKAPSYTVEEIDLPAGSRLVRIDNATGTLAENATVNVVAYNEYEEHEGSFKVTKQIIADEKLLDGLDMPTFEITATISGTFEMDGERVVDSSREVSFSLQGGETYTSPTIKWWGDAAPTVTVTESNIPLGWKNISISNNGAPVGDELEIVVTNQLDVLTIIDLTMKLAGYVWEDAPRDVDGKNTTDSVANGLKDEFERAVKGIEVFIYKPDGSLAEVFDNGALISQPLYTDAIGHWEAPNMKVLENGTYDIEFVYDGQTYEPTKFLATSNGDANAYRNASTSERDKWEKDSKALDYDREVVNSRIQEIAEGSAIDGNGNTVGKVYGSEGEHSVMYSATNAADGLDTRTGFNGSARLTSELQTTNEDGTVLNLFKAKARTSVGGLTYPFDKKIHLDSVDTYISELGLVQYYKYSATYNYMLNINLGLVPRPEADFGISKDLVTANVIVNNHLTDERFNKLDDYGQDLLERQIAGDTQNIEYDLALSSTDYFYRAEMYQASAEGSNIEAYDALETFYKSLDLLPQDTELDVYLTYKIKLYNESTDYQLRVNRVNDYFDSSFGSPISTTIERYVKTINGQAVSNSEIGEKRVVANPSTLNGQTITWNVVEQGIKGSDGITYNKMSADLNGLTLGAGETAEVLVTFALEKQTIGSVHDAIELGNKSNVVEIASYQTLDNNGKNAGKIDRDSAPGNVNIESYNEKMWYEDDTDSAPVLDLTVVTTSNAVTGRAWEDNEHEGTVGAYDDDEALIAGLTTQIVEKITVKTNEGKYVDYDFIWPTNKPLSALGGNTVEYLTGFDSTVETQRVRNEEEDLNVGDYKFNNVPDGNYAVRFLYGNDKSDLEDTLGITGDPVAVKADGTVFSGNENILTANYDEDVEGMTAAVYNGHDYKSTIYQGGVAGDNLVTNLWHDLDADATNRLSDARDSESRRLELIAETETMMHELTALLATANSKTADHTELYDQFGMYAETAKIDVAKGGASVQEVTVVSPVISTTSVKVSEEATERRISNIDCAIVERPETAVVLDKQIKQVKLTTNDNRVIFNALYDITPKFVKTVDTNKGVLAKVGDCYLVVEKSLNPASVAIDQLQSLDKVEDKVDNPEFQEVQNFRYINVDDEILQGTTIEINYEMTAYNVGDEDRTSATLANIETTAKANGTSIKAEIQKLAAEVEKDLHEAASLNEGVEFGKYLGKAYYTGNSTTDQIVTTRVRQVVDYIDNDAVFTQEKNNSKDHSWRNTSLNELDGNGYDSERLVSRDVIPQYELLDKTNVNYVTESRNNLVLSIDLGEYPLEESAASTTNSGFSKELVPVKLNETLMGADVENPDDYKGSIELTITRTVSAQDDADKLQFDNISEVVKIENTVGRRDMMAVTGNANPTKGEFIASLPERDSSATELVTFAPPTGIKAEVTLTMQILLISLVALVIVAVGVVIIKKTVLK